jgi:peptidoglycan/LPS O-acetylase OafA/YrhL
MNLRDTCIALALVGASVLLFSRNERATSPRLPASTIAILDWLRGIAAVAVLVGHVRGLFMQERDALGSTSLLWKAFYIVTGLGHQAVIVFFILSGFLVGSTVLARTADGTWDTRDYLIRRLTRLYAVLLPGLLLTAALDFVGLSWFGPDGLYGGMLNARYMEMPDVRKTLSWAHFLGNLFFLQHIFIAPFGSNGPLWSLSYEFWAYLLFPVLIAAGTASISLPARASCFLIAALAVAIGGWKLGLYFGIWLMGAAVALWWRRRSMLRMNLLARIAAIACFMFAVLLARASVFADATADILLGAATAALVASLLTYDASTAPGRTAVVWRVAGGWLAGFSYTLYIAHYPVLTFIFAATLERERMYPSASAVFTIIGISAAVMLLYAYPLSRLTEAHTERLRAWLSRSSAAPGRQGA